MGGRVTEVVIPYAPRPLQWDVHRGLESHRWAVAVCHRRFGKTVLAVNHLQKQALTCPKDRPRYAYVAPTYRQGKATAWDYMKHYAQAVPGAVPHESELRIDYGNGGQVRIYGADNPDSLRGIYLDGVVLDEYGMHPPNVFSEVLRPALADRQGWALFLGTPSGKNQFYDAVQTAKRTEGWWFGEFKASETKLLPESELAAARSVMTADEYAQEFECSFEASVKGAVFAREIQALRESGHVCRVPYDPAMPVDTDWDLGVGDSTAIWFTQAAWSGEVRVIDYYENSGQGLSHYVDVLHKKGYTYGIHGAPHDIEVREFGSGRSRISLAAGLGVHFRPLPQFSLEDGIHAARMILPKCYFDAERCSQGLEALQHYRWDYNTRINEFKPVPVHDWASHGADAFRYFALRHSVPKEKKPKASRDYEPGWDDRPHDISQRSGRYAWANQRRGGY